MLVVLMKLARFIPLFPIIMVILLTTLVSSDDQHRVDTRTTDNGLQQNSLTGLTQTEDGYIWFTTEDDRAQALRDMGAEVVAGNLLDLDSMHRVIAGCETIYFGMSVSDDYPAATANAATFTSSIS